MSSVLKPENPDQLKDAVAWAVGNKAPVEVVGTGTKSPIGRIMQTEASIDVSGLVGITLYEPEELVLSARAGTPLSEIEAALAANHQEMAFEPPDLSGLIGTADAGTLGGLIAANLAGPRRLKAGAARDHFLGFNAVTGRGEAIKSGSRVMKNVTGYDLPKILAGSWGTLGIMSDITIKVLPAAETQITLALAGLDGAAATRVMSAALRSSCEVSGAAYLPQNIASASRVVDVSAAAASLTMLRLEGIEPSVEFRATRLKELLSSFGEVIRLEAAASRSVWIEVRDVHYLGNDAGRIVWRLSVPPTEGANVLSAIGQTGDVRGFLDWAGGLIWLDMPVSDHGSAQLVRGAFAGTTGHATLIRAPQALRAALPVFEPQMAALQGLTSRLKDAFDPYGILNPGRIYA
ncbi:MAG: FAD-binding protein [Hyphomicrobiales bacterium]|nr:FAD-binding protein [Hyphomicrobiales bacterium]